MTKLLLILSIFLFVQNIKSQDFMIVDEKSLEIDISVNSDGSLKITATEEEIKSVSNPTKAEKDDYKEYLFFDPSFESEPKIEAWTINPNSNKKRKILPQSVEIHDYISRGIFYQGTKIKQFEFNSVEQDSKLYFKSEQSLKDPHLIPSFYFDDFRNVKKATFKIIYDEGITVDIKQFNLSDLNLQTQTESVKGRIVQTLTATNVNSYKSLKDDRGRSCSSPHIVPMITSYSTDGEVVQVLGSLENLQNWYSEMVFDYELSEQNKAMLNQFKSETDDNQVLAERIFNWVQSNIKYVAFEDGYGGFTPRNPNNVVTNKYGDCKDMALLTHTMMKYCNLPCYIAWVGTRSKCYSYNECPAPVVDNHMIVAYNLNDSIIFMDPTSNTSQFGIPSGFTQGKESLVRLDGGKFKVYEIPVLPSKYSSDNDVILLNISNNTLYGKSLKTIAGYNKVRYDARLKHASYTPKETFTRTTSYGNETFQIADFEQISSIDKFETLTDFEFKIENYIQNFDSSTYINPFIKDVINFRISRDANSYQFDHTFINSATVSLALPEGGQLLNKIEDTVISSNGFTLTISSYEDENNHYIIEYSFKCERIEIDVTEIEEVKSALKKMRKVLKQQIEIKNA